MPAARRLAGHPREREGEREREREREREQAVPIAKDPRSCLDLYWLLDTIACPIQLIYMCVWRQKLTDHRHARSSAAQKHHLHYGPAPPGLCGPRSEQTRAFSTKPNSPKPTSHGPPRRVEQASSAPPQATKTDMNLPSFVPNDSFRPRAMSLADLRLRRDATSWR